MMVEGTEQSGPRSTATFRAIAGCRICGNQELHEILDLGDLPLSAVFPGAGEPDAPSAPIRLVKCAEPGGCGLVQLAHTVESDSMYATSAYGYRSGINEMMRAHLATVVSEIENRRELRQGDVVLDIGSNDATLLKSYSTKGLVRIGIDPTSEQYSEYYDRDIARLPAYFSRAAFESVSVGTRAAVITSIAMFYDLEDPNAFVADVADCLAPDGFWVLEQSYMPTMLRMNSFDTLCHEHLEYYRLSDIQGLCLRHGLQVLDVTFNDINGGSFRITAGHAGAHGPPSTRVAEAEARERAEALDTHTPYARFAEKVAVVRDQLYQMVRREVDAGRVIMAYGASTKGNIILSYCGLDHSLIAAAAERNPLKYSRRTPGTAIPIIPESDARKASPNAFLVLPWSFIGAFMTREKDYLMRGGKFLVPLPQPEFRT